MIIRMPINMLCRLVKVIDVLGHIFVYWPVSTCVIGNFRKLFY
jgi:hypothetical protein